MTIDPEYKVTDAERAMLDKQELRRKDSCVVPRVVYVNDRRGFRIELDHPDQAVARSLLKEALGTASDAFYDGLLRQLYVVVDEDSGGETDLNFLIASIIAGKPRDEQETQLLANLAIVSFMQTKFAGNYCRADRLFDQVKGDLRQKDNPYTVASGAAAVKNLSLLLDSFERGTNRFARTYGLLLEGLVRYRRSRAPARTVQRVTVGLVGNITNASAANDPAANQQALSEQRQSAMPSIGEASEPDREALPLRRRKSG